VKISIITLGFIMFLSGVTLSLAVGCSSRDGAYTESQRNTNSTQSRNDNLATQRMGGPSNPYGVGAPPSSPYGMRAPRR